MRYLNFKVKGQTIGPIRIGELNGLVAGTSGYVGARFLFSDDWKGCAKVAAFNLVDGTELEPSALDKENSCLIPRAVLEYHEFDMKLLGRGTGGYVITTRPIRIKQFGGKK